MSIDHQGCPGNGPDIKGAAARRAQITQIRALNRRRPAPMATDHIGGDVRRAEPTADCVW
jgi:hypothetical protein